MKYSTPKLIEGMHAHMLLKPFQHSSTKRITQHIQISNKSTAQTENALTMTIMIILLLF